MSLTSLKIIIIVSVCLRSCSTACPSPYTQLSSGHCAYWNTSYSVNWCQAAELCLSIGGELAIDLGLIRAVKSQISTAGVFVGFTDLLIERGTNKTGWQLTNGSIVVFDDADWSGGPGNSVTSDDFGLLRQGGVTEIRFEFTRSFLCQPLVTPDSGQFIRASFLGLGNISPYYCYTELTDMRSEIECTLRCTSRWQCRDAIYNSADGRCRMLDFSDANAGDEIETDPNWTKLVKVY